MWHAREIRKTFSSCWKMWKVLISSLNYSIQCSISTYCSSFLTSYKLCTFFSTCFFFRFHFNSYRNLLKVFNSIISVQLIIFLIAVSSLMYSHKLSKHSLYIFVTLLWFWSIRISVFYSSLHKEYISLPTRLLVLLS